MCRKYGGQRTPAFVRLCYRKGQLRGTKVYYAGGQPVLRASGCLDEIATRRAGVRLNYGAPVGEFDVYVARGKS